MYRRIHFVMRTSLAPILFDIKHDLSRQYELEHRDLVRACLRESEIDFRFPISDFQFPMIDFR